MSRFATMLVGLAVLGSAAVLLICLLITSRSLHAIADARSPATAYDAPATQPFVVAFKPPPTTGPSVRVAVIGGMTFTGFWNALAERYEKQTGVYVDLIATGPKNDIVSVFRQGGVDVITMHASDTMINLVADGYTLDPQPWMRNDLIIVGPPEDPAGIKGMTDAAAALKKIAAAKSPFVVHSSLGAQEVLLNIMGPNQIVFDPAQTTVLFDDQQRSVLKVAGEKHAYTLVGRIPFRIGRLPNDGLVLMVQGDERLQRPYLVAVTNPQWMPGVHIGEARRFAAYLRTPQTQAWIAEFGKGMLDERPIFFPVAVPDLNPPLDGKIAVRVGGEVDTPLALSQKDLEQLPHVEVHVADRSGKKIVYSGVPLNAILKKAGVPIGQHRLRGDSLSLCLVVTGADGYRGAFALPELDDDFAVRSIILADHRDGQPIDSKEGPLRVIAPQDSRPARWVRNVIWLRVSRVGG